MSNQEYNYEKLCRKCYVKLLKPTKKEISKIVMTEYDDKCDNCGRVCKLVDYIEENN